METNLTFRNLENTLNFFIDDFIRTYKDMLIRDNKKASGNLISSLRPMTIEFTNNKLYGEISIANYWKYVEYGRRPGKFPPMKNILNWIKVKPVIPRPLNGLKPPTEEQLAFLVSRKIAREGIKAGNQFTDSLNLAWTRWKDRISNAISEDLQSSIDLINI